MPDEIVGEGVARALNMGEDPTGRSNQTTQARVMARIAAIRAVMDGATKGKWSVSTPLGHDTQWLDVVTDLDIEDEEIASAETQPNPAIVYALDRERVKAETKRHVANLRAIALAHNISPAMLDLVERDCALLDWLEQANPKLFAWAANCVRDGLKAFLGATDELFPEEGKGTNDTMNFTDEQIKYMRDRFLSWTLPKNFNPDGGITYKRSESAIKYNHPGPVGTNLLDAEQAEAMIRFMVEGLP